MELIRTLTPSACPSSPTALVIGNFDGLHLGHQALIDRMQALASHHRLTPALMCFEPLPATYFAPAHPISRLMSVRDKIKACKEFGIERLMMLRFHQNFAALSPEAFVQQAIVDRAKAKHVVVGEDFRFGAKAAGDVSTLKSLGQRLGFEVHPVEKITQFGERISSTRIRESLALGDLESVESLLGRAYTISGRVLRGQQLGRQIGYPTVNIRPPNPPALRGIYAVWVSVENGSGVRKHPGVASLGSRPTVNGQDWLLEVHLFDYDGSLYGHHLEVTFEAFIRLEEKFDSVGAMVEEMHRDAQKARAILHHPTPTSM